MTVARAPGNRDVRGLRPPKSFVDPWHAHGTSIDDERRPDGTIERALTIFLAGSECTFACSFCDLWRYTIDGPTPPGAIPQQISASLAGTGGVSAHRLKLYNASNFFDARAVPPSDWPAIADHARGFRHVTVESHASMIGPRVRDFASQLEGRLEVAIGLETVHPDAMARLNKRLDITTFDRAAEYLATHDIDLRVFVLVGAPDIHPDDATEWTIRTVRHAASRGAAMIALIPVRDGNGMLEHLAAERRFTRPTLGDLETALDGCVDIPNTVVAADLWDAARFTSCHQCAEARIERMRRINLSGVTEPRVACSFCAG